MLNLEKIYTQKSNATRDIKKAVSRGVCNLGEHEARKVDGGFQIFVIDTAENATKTTETVIESSKSVIVPDETVLNVQLMILSAYNENAKLVKGRRLDKTEFRETVMEKVIAQITDITTVDSDTIAALTISTINELMAEPVAFCPMNENEQKMLETIPLLSDYTDAESQVNGKAYLQKVKELHNIEITTSRALMVSLKRKKYITIGGGRKTFIILLERGIRHLNKAS